MPRAPVLEKASSLRALGAGFIVLLLFFVWLTWAFFSHAFTERVTVYLKSQSAGLQLPMSADVKLRGMIVGEVSGIETSGNGVTLTLALRPDAVQSVPAGVTAQIVPKTLFGQKYVALIPPDHPSGDHIRAGATIPKANVPIEVEKLLNDLYPLLKAVQPAELSYALSAISGALAGNGQRLGQTITTLNAYLTNLNPDVPTLIDDLRTLGTVSDIYADATPDLTRFLGNAAVTSRTIVTQRQNLISFFDNTEALAKTLETFFKRSGNDLVALNRDARPVLDTVGYYSPSFPCFLAGMNKVIPREDSAFRGGKLNQMLDLADGDQGPFPQSHPYAYPDDSLYPLSGMATRHNKFCIPPPNWNGAWGPCDDSAFRAAAGSDAGVGTPDIAALLLQAGSG